MLKKIYQTMFPTIEDGLWGEIDLNECVKSFRPHWMSGVNPMLDPLQQTKFVNEMHKQMGRDYSYGGYLEDRSTMWRGHYHDPNKMIHLGIDFNVPANTPVYTPFGGWVVFKRNDKDQNGGWGTRIDFLIGETYWIVAHLRPDSDVKVGDSFSGYGMLLGHTASHKRNGGWFPHVHLQCVSKAEYESQKPMEIDGYGEGGSGLRARFPNPKRFFDFIHAECD